MKFMTIFYNDEALELPILALGDFKDRYGERCAETIMTSTGLVSHKFAALFSMYRGGKRFPVKLGEKTFTATVFSCKKNPTECRFEIKFFSPPSEDFILS